MSIYTDMQQLQDLNIKSKMYNSVYNILLPMFLKKKKRHIHDIEPNKTALFRLLKAATWFGST